MTSREKAEWLSEKFGGGDELYVDIDDLYGALDRLKTVIAEADHGRDCESTDNRWTVPRKCNCWKLNAMRDQVFV